ncbi:hypothetical protein FHW83_002373 [Duganella sp. SG902]|uniref:glycosyl hydrolase n=1 Tax=Duganella sp. SG902 TaxID=2587016 RepID=UPI00159D133A|nr:glycosyl hydrolase [Duganella sp. SG902]NVM76578.1 hypothetical protein [Duganella sp. SG902]
MHRFLKFLPALLACLCAGALAAPSVLYSPYKHLAIDSGVPAPYVKGGALTWAFASGECGSEVWGRQSAQQVADSHVAAFVQAGVDYVVSTGGQGAVFTCASDEGMERFIARYQSPRLIGIDFDIEEGQNEQQINSLAERAAAAQQRHPGLRFSFTIATHAASDGSQLSLNATGEMVLKAARGSGLRDYALNLMVMDYGPATRANCVVRKGRCDMGRSAIQAARNVHAKYGVPLEQIELTVMIGVNDVLENVFTLDDARTVTAAVRRMKLAGLHFWSLDRDQPCSAASGATGTADARCNGMKQVPAGAYLRALSGEGR